ncbi:DUF5687 family protein [Mucilaginibacter auburnensis]|uniref:ABC-2 type transport system permease protein n=1 Tax=Mucilaginibacter auburnensis TaxID=1457233 RepID=A0A2H9VSB4_9SPHI|nr:DUF5687 family protein [Mucilaginibacter auburnensis]PJJ83713.1 hypothetical protein CLV57_0706 [Mucilaginibacter auburnensis]
MISTFLRHELKAFWRSKNTGKSIGVRIFMGLLILYFLISFLVVGFLMDKIIEDRFPNEDLTVVFCGFVLIYFLFDLLSRLQLQELPTLRVQPYLHLPVRRNLIVGYLAFTALFSFFNLWPFILAFPFIFKVIVPNWGGAAVGFIISVLAISVFNNYLAIYIKRKANLNGWVFIIFTGVLALLIAGDFSWHLYSIRNISYLFFGNVLKHPALALIPVALAAGMFALNFFYLKRNLYLEELSRKKASYKTSTEYPILDRFGAIGDQVANEIKLILRNKRPRSAFIMSAVFLCYGLVFYKNPAFAHSDWPKVFVGMFMTGFFIISYGQFLYSWQAAHFDGLMVSKVSFTDFLKAKILLFTTVSTVALVLTTPYAYFGWRTVLIHAVMYIWNLGINIYIVLFFANRNARRIDLSKGASFNWEGVGATQMLLSFPLMAAPYLIYTPFALLHLQNAGLAVMAIIGVAGIASRNFWIGKLVQDFYNRKYTITEGFRNK